MKKTKICPKCDCKKLLRIDWVADYGGSDGGSAKASLAIRHEGYSFMGNEKRKLVGELEAITCSECGYTEYYCLDAKKIEPDNKFIFWL